MPLESIVQLYHRIECDSCRIAAPLAFSKYAAIFRAKRYGFTLREISEKSTLWLCPKCRDEEKAAEKLEPEAVQKAPLRPALVRR